MRHQGLYTALVTPFKDHHVDVAAYKQLIEDQILAGVAGVVPVGTTGESPTLSAAEHIEVIRLAVDAAAGRIDVIAGSGSNSTREAIELTLEAEQAGASGTLQVVPYYNKPSQEGIYRHYRAIAESCALPIMMYSIPGRSGVEIGVETAARLAQECSNIISIKEAGGSVDRVNQLVQTLPSTCTVLSGDDGLTLPFMSCGAVGLVSVSSNLIPSAMVELVQACLEDRYADALGIQKKYYPLMKGIMSLDTNPVPIKAALALCGRMDSEVRLPLAGLNPAQVAVLQNLLAQFDIH